MQIDYRRALRGALLASASMLGGGLGHAFGAVIDYPDASTNSNPIVLTDNTTQLQVLTGSATQSGVISESGGSFGFEKIGTGILTLTGNNTYTGGTTIAAGTVIAGSSTAFGAGTVTMAAGTTLGFATQDTISNNIALTGTGTVFVGSSQSMELDGIISDANATIPGMLAVSGGGYLILGGDNTYTGGTVINGGVLQVGGFGNTNAGSLGSGNVLDNGGLIFLRTVPTIFAGSISGTGAVQIGGSFPGGPPTGVAVTLSGNNTYSGATTVLNGSILVAGSATAFSGNSAFTINSTTGAGISLNGFNSTVGSLAGTSTATVSAGAGGAATLTTGGNNTSTTFSGRLLDGSGGSALGLTKTGNGTFTLTNAGNTYTGLTTISAGTLALTFAGSIATSNGVTDNGVFDIQGITAASATIKSLNGSGSVLLGAKSLVLSAGAGTFSGVISGSGGLTQSGTGTQVLAGANT